LDERICCQKCEYSGYVDCLGFDHIAAGRKILETNLSYSELYRKTVLSG